MRISTQFYLLVAVPFFLVIAFAISVTYQSAELSGAVGRRIANIQRTETLNQQLTRSNIEQSVKLRRQLERLDPEFPQTARETNYRLGEEYAQYLKLDIEQRERLTVETIKGLQDELSVVSMHVYEQLRSGHTAEASRRLEYLSQIEGRVRDEIGILNAIQIARLQATVARLNRTARIGSLAASLLIGALVLVMAAVVFVIRRRFIVPVHALLEASDRVRQRDWTARVPAARHDELGELAGAFNFMAESLAESYATLERRVEERTRQLRETQQQLVQAEKMSATGVLVSGVAHELNNPLAAIMGSLELARMELAGGNPARAADTLGSLDSQVERCRRIVANLLQFVRKSGRTTSVFRINAALDQVLQMREYELGTRNIAIIRDFDRADPVLSGDREKIQQVALNLLNNAHDAILDAGRPGTIRVRTRTEPGKVVIDLSDDGIGFHEVGRVFDPFYTTKAPGKGTGLGLSLCYGIVQEHGGEITAQNLERGAQVTVVLPIGDVGAGTDDVAAAPDVAPASGAVPAPDVAPTPVVTSPGTSAPVGTAPRLVHALVVDDEPPLLRLQAAFLAKFGVTAATAASADEAVRYLQEHDVDLIVSDVRMPGELDGIGLYEWVERNQPRLTSRFIFASGDLVGLNLGDFFTRTSVPQVSKPFRYAEYTRVIEQVLGTGGASG